MSTLTDKRFERFVELLHERIETGRIREALEKQLIPEKPIKLRELTQLLDEWCKERNLYSPKTQTISSWLKRLGFRTGKTKPYQVSVSVAAG